MTSPSLTYTLTNGATADASQVQQNFNDLLNGLTDGTKDLSISALTCAGTATLNGHVNLGNASADDLTISASLASSLPIKTNNSYDIGSSTLGLRKLYLGNGGAGATCDIVAASHATTREYTIPDCSAAASFVMTQGTQTLGGTYSLSQSGAQALTLTTTGSATNASMLIKSGDGTTSTRNAFITYQSLETSGQQWDAGLYGDKLWTLKDVTNSKIYLTADNTKGGVTLRGRTDGQNAAAGIVGEILRSSVTTTSGSGVTPGQFGNITSLTLTAGHWLVFGTFDNIRAGGQTEIYGAISIHSGDTTTDHVSGYTQHWGTCEQLGNGNTQVMIGPIDQSVTGNTDIYMKAKLDAGAWGTGNFPGTLMAIRVS